MIQTTLTGLVERPPKAHSKDTTQPEMGRSKYKMGRLVDGAWFCKCNVRAEWKTAGPGTPNAKKKCK